jgi:outer membrane protein OmpA-like peptidoglycan-associated protein
VISQALQTTALHISVLRTYSFGETIMAKRMAWAVAIAAVVLAGLTACKKPQQPQQPVPAAVPAPPPPAPVSAAAPAPPQGWSPAPGPDVHVSLDPLPTQKGDVAGGHDVAFLKRFQGAQLIGYVSRPYDKLSIFDSTRDTGPAHAFPVEGQVTRMLYHIGQGHSALEVLRNYEDLAKSAGLAQTSEIPCVSDFSFFPGTDFDQIPWGGQLTDPFYLGGTNPTNEGPFCYFTARGTTDGRPIALSVLVAEKHRFLGSTGADGKPIAYKDGDVVVLVDLVAAKPVQDQMVTVKAADMADALASKGFIDLYGVYFDTDKTTLKPESDATLSEVASLLKIDRSLKLEVSGHTDNTGSPAHNTTLSQGRADAVVQALATKYGIDKARLVAKGYGDTKPVAPNTDDAGKAKNRRVELRKL